MAVLQFNTPDCLFKSLIGEVSEHPKSFSLCVKITVIISAILNHTGWKSPLVIIDFRNDVNGHFHQYFSLSKPCQNCWQSKTCLTRMYRCYHSLLLRMVVTCKPIAVEDLRTNPFEFGVSSIN